MVPIIIIKRFYIYLKLFIYKYGFMCFYTNNLI